MVTNKKFTRPAKIIPPLTLKKNSPLRYPPPQKILNLSKKHPSPRKKKQLPNLHDPERFHKNCVCALSTL